MAFSTSARKLYGVRQHPQYHSPCFCGFKGKYILLPVFTFFVLEDFNSFTTAFVSREKLPEGEKVLRGPIFFSFLNFLASEIFFLSLFSYFDSDPKSALAQSPVRFSVSKQPRTPR